MLANVKFCTLGITLAMLVMCTTTLQARPQNGYIKKDGTYVQPHQKSNPDGKRYNNKGSETNGGKQRDEFSSPPAYNKSRNL